MQSPFGEGLELSSMELTVPSHETRLPFLATPILDGLRAPLAHVEGPAYGQIFVIKLPVTFELVVLALAPLINLFLGLKTRCSRLIIFAA